MSNTWFKASFIHVCLSAASPQVCGGYLSNHPITHSQHCLACMRPWETKPPLQKEKEGTKLAPSPAPHSMQFHQAKQNAVTIHPFLPQDSCFF